MESLKVAMLLGAMMACVAFAEHTHGHRHDNCHHYPEHRKPASETRPRCPPGPPGSHHQHHGHELPPGHVYGQPTGTASIIMQFMAELRAHKDHVVEDLKKLPEAERASKFQGLLDSLKNHTELPSWVNDHCKEYVGNLNRVHKKKFFDVLSEEVNVRRLP